jgi:hypothetical protein
LISWLDAGVRKEAIRFALNEIRSEFQLAGREAEEDRILEVLDLVEGWVSPHLRLPASRSNGADMSPTRDVATALLPSGGEFAQIETDLVVPALIDEGLQVFRPSQHMHEANAVFALIDNIERSDVVVVDVTGLDAFLLYALGMAHALGRPTILLTQDINEMPFDLRSYNVVLYSTRLDEISRLKDDLRKMVIGLAEVGYTLATPVTDMRRSRRVMADAHEVVSPEEELPGIFDLIPSSIEALEGIAAATVKFGELTDELGSAVQIRATEVEAAKARGGPGAFGRTLLVIKAVTAYVDEYADKVANVLPGYRDQWSTFVDDTLRWLELVDVESNEDREAGQSFTTELAKLGRVLLETVEQVEGFREAVVGLRSRRLSKDLSRSLSRVDMQLREWIEQALTGASHVERMRALLAERLQEPNP